MKKIIFLFAIILFITPLKIVFSQYGGFNDSPFKEGALVTAVKTGKLKDIVTALNSGASLNEKDFDEVFMSMLPQIAPPYLGLPGLCFSNHIN